MVLAAAVLVDIVGTEDVAVAGSLEVVADTAGVVAGHQRIVVAGKLATLDAVAHDENQVVVEVPTSESGFPFDDHRTL